MNEAKDPDWRNYPSFNQFFTRELKEGARTIVGDKNAIACPVDGGYTARAKYIQLIPINLDGDPNLDIFTFYTDNIYWYEFF